MSNLAGSVLRGYGFGWDLFPNAILLLLYWLKLHVSHLPQVEHPKVVHGALPDVMAAKNEQPLVMNES